MRKWKRGSVSKNGRKFGLSASQWPTLQEFEELPDWGYASYQLASEENQSCGNISPSEKDMSDVEKEEEEAMASEMKYGRNSVFVTMLREIARAAYERGAAPNPKGLGLSEEEQNRLRDAVQYTRGLGHHARLSLSTAANLNYLPEYVCMAMIAGVYKNRNSAWKALCRAGDARTRADCIAVLNENYPKAKTPSEERQMKTIEERLSKIDSEALSLAKARAKVRRSRAKVKKAAQKPPAAPQSAQKPPVPSPAPQSAPMPFRAPAKPGTVRLEMLLRNGKPFVVEGTPAQIRNTLELLEYTEVL